MRRIFNETLVMWGVVVFSFVIVIFSLADMLNFQQNINTVHSDSKETTTIHLDYAKEVKQIKALFDKKLEEIITIDTNSITIDLNQYGLELPINGATGYTSTKLNLYDSKERNKIVMTMVAGTAFKIIDEYDDMWYVQVGDVTGYIEHLLCMINLPDVIPSMVYCNSNSEHSLFMSRGNELPDVTSKQLYNTMFYNERFGEKQFSMPILYSTAKLVCSAQNLALRSGHTLVLYEGFRPADTQKQVCNALESLIKTNSDVKAHTADSFGTNWFICKSISNHQKGYAIDVSLANITSARYNTCGDYSYLHIDEYEEMEMPTRIHELSDDAATFSYAISSKDKNAWKFVPLASSMNEAAILLQFYCTESGMTPLASEWWHFNDLTTREAIGNRTGNGNFYITSVVSSVPE